MPLSTPSSSGLQPLEAQNLHIYRGKLLRFAAHADQAQAVWDEDGAILVAHNTQGRAFIQAAGAAHEVLSHHPQVQVTHWPDRIIAPGFVDMHIHYPQTDVIGSPASGLLPWLENYTFPAESRFSDKAVADEVAHFFFDELIRNGVTTALTFCTSHPASADAFFAQAQKRNLRMMGGKVLQDRHSPDGVRDDTEQGLLDTQALIERWHKKDRLGYAITPRFAPTSSLAQLKGAAELAHRYSDTWIQSHVSENLDEIAWVAELFPQARSYLSVYDDVGLMRKRAVYAHCIYLDDMDRALLRQRQTAAAVCPTSNLFLSSGFFDFIKADAEGFAYGLASDVGGGTSFSPFRTMLAAYFVGRESHAKKGSSIAPSELWYRHTAGAAKALDLDGVVGNLQIGCEADFVVINPQASPLIARRTQQAQTLEELLFSLIVLGDDRLIEQVAVNGVLQR